MGVHITELELSTSVEGFKVRLQSVIVIHTRHNVIFVVAHNDPVHLCPHHCLYQNCHRRDAPPNRPTDTPVHLPYLGKYSDQPGPLHSGLLFLPVSVPTNILFLEANYPDRERIMWY